jgi:glycosyltransferase involved in cell wall biosynthesis
MSEKGRLIHLISSNRWGGAQRYALDLCSQFASEGWSVTAYTRDAEIIDRRFKAAGINLRHAPLRGWFDIASVAILASDLKHESYNTIIHVHHYRDAFTALVARKLSGRKDIKIVSTRHVVRRGRDSFLYSRVYRNIDCQIFVSEIALRRFISAWPYSPLPFPESRLKVIHNSIRIADIGFTPQPDKGPKVAMFHGPLVPGKGLETLIDALPQVKGHRLRLRIVGSGDSDYTDKLRRRAQARGVMEMIDWKKDVDDAHPLIRQCHFGVLPSVIAEAFGLSNIEYLANSRPVICTNNGAQPEYMTDGHEAIMIAPSDTAALSEAMIRLADDDALREEMSRTAYESFTLNMPWHKYADKMRKVYEEVLSH